MMTRRTTITTTTITTTITTKTTTTRSTTTHVPLFSQESDTCSTVIHHLLKLNKNYCYGCKRACVTHYSTVLVKLGYNFIQTSPFESERKENLSLKDFCIILKTPKLSLEKTTFTIFCFVCQEEGHLYFFSEPMFTTNSNRLTLV